MLRRIPLVILAGLFAVACDGAIATAPEAAGTLPTALTLDAVTTAGVTVFWFAGPTPVPGASSKVTRNGSGVTGTLHTGELTPGNVYTLWLLVFNDPGECAGSPCMEPDLFNPDVGGDVLKLAGNVAGGSGQATFSGRRAAGDNSNSLFGQLGLPAPGLTDPYGAELHLIVRDHGPAIPGQIPGQIQTFEGGCTAGTSFGLGNGQNACADIQFSIHP